MYVVLALAGAAVALGVIELGGFGSKHGTPGGDVGSTSVVAIQAVGSYDPTSDGGDGSEHNDSVADATDGKPSTFWTTDIYRSPSFGGLKPGVGLVLDAGTAVALKTLTVVTDTPGFTAKIQAGASASGPFSDDSSTQTVNGTTTFALRGTTARYYVVWLTSLPPGNTAHVNEIRARR